MIPSNTPHHLNAMADPNGLCLKVWWIPQVPMKPFEVLVSSFAQAKVLLETLAEYDLFQLRQNIKPEFCNVGGLLVFEDGDWTDFWTDNGEDFDALTLQQCVELDIEEKEKQHGS